MKYAIQPNIEISALLPYYTPVGDSSLIYTAAGEKISVAVKIKTVIRQLASRQAIDLYQLKAKTAQLTKCTIWQTLVLAPDLVLVPLKIRKPKISGDATGGYFNFHQIKSTRSAANGTCVELKSGEKITVLWKTDTVDAHLQRAHLAALAQGNQQLFFENFTRSLIANTLSTMPAAFSGR